MTETTEPAEQAEPNTENDPSATAPHTDAETPIQPKDIETGYTPSDYRVEQRIYEGPLDVLLFMIKDHDVDIFSVSLSTIAEEFLEYVLQMEEPDLAEVGDFLVIAGQLMVMKSRQLLPTETCEEEEEPVDEQALLLARLKDYETFKEAANVLRKAEEERRLLYMREKPPPTVEKRESIDYYEINVFDLAKAFQRVMSEIGDDQPSIIQGEEYTIDEKMAEFQLLLEETGELCLTVYLQGLTSRVEIIVSFLAMLELMRHIRIKARQSVFFGDIWLYRTDPLSRDDDGDMDLAVTSEEVGFVGDQPDGNAVHENDTDEATSLGEDLPEAEDETLEELEPNDAPETDT